MKNLKTWVVGSALALVMAGLAGCGGGSDGDSSSGQIRLINATTTHASIDLVRTDSDDTARLVAAVATDTASDYVDLGGDGSTSLQVRDANGTTALVSTSATVDEGDHYAVVAYESDGTVRTVSIAETTDEPDDDSALLRVLDLAVDAGDLDVYVTDPAVDLASVSRNFGIAKPAVTTGSLSFSPGTYRIRVTAAGSKTDLRLDMTAELANKAIASVLLTPTRGGILLNGSVLVQEGAYTAVRNGNARVRLLAALSDSSSVTARAGSSVISSAAGSPAVGIYVTVPTSGAALDISVDGDALTLPSSLVLTAGSDSTLLVHGDSDDPTVKLLADDNHLPTTTTNIKMRLVNGLTGNSATLSLSADFKPVASGVRPAEASAYTQVTGNESMRLDVNSSLSATPIYSESDINVQPNGVWSLFMFGNATAPAHVLVRDR